MKVLQIDLDQIPLLQKRTQSLRMMFVYTSAIYLPITFTKSLHKKGIKLVHVLLCDIFLLYFGMISRYFGTKICYDISQFLYCFCEIFFEANSMLIMVRWLHWKNSAAICSLFWLGRKEKVNKLSWYHPKLTYEIIVQKDMKDFMIYYT